MTDGHMYPQPQPRGIDGVVIIACKHCGEAVARWKLIDDYCRDCAEVLIDNLSPTDIAQVWKKLDERKGADAS